MGEEKRRLYVTGWRESVRRRTRLVLPPRTTTQLIAPTPLFFRSTSLVRLCGSLGGLVCRAREEVSAIRHHTQSGRIWSHFVYFCPQEYLVNIRSPALVSWEWWAEESNLVSTLAIVLAKPSIINCSGSWSWSNDTPLLLKSQAKGDGSWSYVRSLVAILQFASLSQ